MARTPPLRANPLRSFLKEQTGLRVGIATAEELATRLVAMLEKLAEVAAASAAAAGRRTLSPTDLDDGLATAFSGQAPATPDALRTALRRLSNADLSRLIHLLRSDLAAAPGEG